MGNTPRELGRRARELNNENLEATRQLKAMIYALDEGKMVLEEVTGERDLVQVKRIVRRAKVLLMLNGTDALKTLDAMADRMHEMERFAAAAAKRGRYDKD